MMSVTSFRKAGLIILILIFGSPLCSFSPLPEKPSELISILMGILLPIPECVILMSKG